MKSQCVTNTIQNALCNCANEVVWMDAEYKQCRSLRRKLERKWKNSRTEENRNNYINQKKVCTEMAISKQTNHYSQLIQKSSGSQSNLFKLANNLLDKNSEKILPAHDDPKQLANMTLTPTS